MSPRKTALTLAFLALAACPGSVTAPPDSGTKLPDPYKDGGTTIIVPPWMPPVDAGWPYPTKYAAEKCPDEAFVGLGVDAGFPEHSVIFGICVPLHSVSGTALLNNHPVQGDIELHVVGGDWMSQLIMPVDAFGGYSMKALRSRYDILQYHPDGIWPNHKGFEEFPTLDLTQDQVRNLAVTSSSVRGSAIFAGLPFTPVAFPPDVTIRAAGIPPDQYAGSESEGGSYELALMQGQLALLLNTPPAALQDTELVDYPLTWSFDLSGPSNYDINVDGSELEGDIRVDGRPIDDRKPGYDFELDYTPSGEMTTVAITHHEGGLMGFHSIVPKGKYSVTLSFDSIPDKHFPAQLFNKQVAQTLDLTHDNTLTKDLTTVPVEGGIVIDGQAPQVNPGYNWVLYMYAGESSTESWFFAYYKIPLDSASFSIRVFPAVYYVAIQLGDSLEHDLVDGYYRISRLKEFTGPDQLPIVINTALVTGKLIIDGKPPPLGLSAGIVTFKEADQSYTRNVFAAEDGSFRIRVPQGSYEVYFQIDPTTYPTYASGRERLISRLDLYGDQDADLVYNTVPVVGPLRVDGQPVTHNTGGNDIQIHLKRWQDEVQFLWGFQSGTPNYLMRIPQGVYDMTFEIVQYAMPGVAYGTAPMGYAVPAVSDFVPPPPAR